MPGGLPKAAVRALKGGWWVKRVPLGLLLGAIGFLRIVLWQTVSPIYGQFYTLVAITIFLSLLGVVAFGTIAGSMLPFILRRCGLASASAPFVAHLGRCDRPHYLFQRGKIILSGTLL